MNFALQMCSLVAISGPKKVLIFRAQPREEGRTASKSPRLRFGSFLFMSQQAVSADIIPNSDVGKFSQKTEGTKAKQLGY